MIETAGGVVILYRLVRKGLSKDTAKTFMMRKSQIKKGLGEECFWLRGQQLQSPGYRNKFGMFARNSGARGAYEVDRHGKDDTRPCKPW